MSGPGTTMKSAGGGIREEKCRIVKRYLRTICLIGGGFFISYCFLDFFSWGVWFFGNFQLFQNLYVR